MAENNQGQGNSLIVIAGKKLVEVEIPTTIYPSYFAFMDEPDCTEKDKADYLEALREYSKGNFDYQSPNKAIRAELRQIRIALKQKRQKYLEKYEQQIEAAKRGGQKTKEKFEKLQNADNKGDKRANARANARGKAKANAEANANITPPSPPVKPGALLDGGGAGFSFGGFCKAVADAEKATPDCITEDIGRSQVIWRIAEYGNRYSNQIGALVYGGVEGEELKSKIRYINVTFPTKTDFQALKLARALMAIPGDVAQIVANEVESHIQEKGIYDTMLAKVSYIREGNKLTSPRAFIQSRKKA